MSVAVRLPARSPVQPGPCPTWCTRTDHGIDDGVHTAAPATVPIDSGAAGPDARDGQATVRAELVDGPDGPVPLVTVELVDCEGWGWLTPAAARRLSVVVLAAADQADGRRFYGS